MYSSKSASNIVAGRSAASSFDVDGKAKVLQDRSKEFDYVTADRETRKAQFKERFESVGALSRFFSLMRLAVKQSGGWKIVGLSGLVIVKIGIAWVSMSQTQDFFSALMGRDVRLLQKTILASLIRGLVQVGVDTVQRFTERQLQVEMLTGLTTHLQNKVLDDSSFYVLKNIDGRIEDMDSRISDDVNKFCEVVSEMWSQFALPLGRILVFSARFARTVE